MDRLPVCLQMYTLRDEAAKDFVGTLRKVADIGYEGVQISGPVEGMSAREIRALLDDLGLRCPSGGSGYEVLEEDLNGAIEYSLELRVPYIRIPFLRTDLRDSADAWKRTAQRMTEMGEEIAGHGMTLVYHNHSFEFERFDGKYGLDILYDESDPRYVHSELDTYWVRHGGADPADYLRRLGSRAPLVHLKDMEEDGSFGEVGEGVMEWGPIFEAAEESGAPWYIVEQDTCKRPPLESVRISLENLREMGKLG